MENNSFDKIYFDYYTNTESYVKAILDFVPNDNKTILNKNIIKTLYNYFLNTASDDKRLEISYISSLFYDQMNALSKEEISKQADYIYNNFLKKMIYDSINRQKLFDIMNECVKVFVGYYSEYQDIRINSVDGVKIEKGSYR